MTFTEPQQKAHRKAFIDECRQKAWSCVCHADWISKSIDELLAHYKKLQTEDNQLEGDTKELAAALDYHTVENRAKRKGMQERRDQLAQQMSITAESAQQGQKGMQQLLQSVESSLELAKHAGEWSWKETDPSFSGASDVIEIETQNSENHGG